MKKFFVYCALSVFMLMPVNAEAKWVILHQGGGFAIGVLEESIVHYRSQSGFPVTEGMVSVVDTGTNEETVLYVKLLEVDWEYNVMESCSYANGKKVGCMNPRPAWTPIKPGTHMDVTLKWMMNYNRERGVQ